MGAKMRRDEAIAERIRKFFEARGRVMPENNLRQADIPVGAEPIPQMPGTAAGLVCPVGDKVIYAVPGVPAEMGEMVLGTVLPDLRRRAGQAAVIRSRVLRTWGLSESGLAEILATRIDELDRLGNPTLAFQASGIDGIKVPIVSKCDDEAAAQRILVTEEGLIRGLLGDVVFGIDDQSMEAVVLDLLRRKGLTLAVAETVTGGLLSARLSALDWAMETSAAARWLHAEVRRPRSGSLSPRRQQRARSSVPMWGLRRSRRSQAKATRPAPSSWAWTSRGTQESSA